MYCAQGRGAGLGREEFSRARRTSTSMARRGLPRWFCRALTRSSPPSPSRPHLGIDSRGCVLVEVSFREPHLPRCARAGSRGFPGSRCKTLHVQVVLTLPPRAECRSGKVEHRSSNSAQAAGRGTGRVELSGRRGKDLRRRVPCGALRLGMFCRHHDAFFVEVWSERLAALHEPIITVSYFPSSAPVRSSVLAAPGVLGIPERHIVISTGSGEHRASVRLSARDHEHVPNET